MRSAPCTQLGDHIMKHVLNGPLAVTELKSYLEKKYPAAFKDASAAYPKYANRGMFSYFSYFSSYVDKSIISAAESSKWLAWMEIIAKKEDADRHLTRDDLKATMNDDEFDALLEAVGAEGKKRTQGAPGGFHAASIPGSDLYPIKPNGKPPLKRRLSDADFRKTLPPAPAENEKHASSGPGSEP